jgi:hypothetical protein
VIIMTSDAEVYTADEMLALGADDCLRKPLTDGVLKTRINKVRCATVPYVHCIYVSMRAQLPVTLLVCMCV